MNIVRFDMKVVVIGSPFSVHEGQSEDRGHTVKYPYCGMCFDTHFPIFPPSMISSSRVALINYMKHHNWKTAKQYSTEYGTTWTKQVIPRTAQDVQLYGWLHNYPYHNQNDLTWWAQRGRPRQTLASYALKQESCTKFAKLLRANEESAIHRLSLGGKKSLLLPTDAAFERAISEHPDLWVRLLADPALSRQFIYNHIVHKSELFVKDIVNRVKSSPHHTIDLRTASGRRLSVRVTGSLQNMNREILFTPIKTKGLKDDPICGPSRVLHHGIGCSNGVVFVMDGLLY